MDDWGLSAQLEAEACDGAVHELNLALSLAVADLLPGARSCVREKEATSSAERRTGVLYPCEERAPGRGADRCVTCHRRYYVALAADRRREMETERKGCTRCGG